MTFGVSGKLWKNALVMYDRETRTLWSHFTGEAIEGPLAGRTLTMLISVPKISWGAWKEKYPHTRVLSVQGREDLRQDTYRDYHASSRTGLFEPEHADRRLRAKEMVIGVQAEAMQKAYPLKKRHWKSNPVILDQIGEMPVVVYFNAETQATGVYDRRLDGQALLLTAQGMHGAVDGEGRRWNLLTGEGPEGKRLTPLPHLRVYWFAWVDFYPKTLLYE